MIRTKQKISRRTYRHEDTHLYDRIAQAYIWHMNEDPVYFIDRCSFFVTNKKTKAFVSALKKLEKGTHLRANDPVEQLLLDTVIQYGQSAAIQLWKNALPKYGFDLNTETPTALKANQNRIPLKAALIVYTHLKSSLRNQSELDEFKIHLDTVDQHPELSGGLLRQAINHGNYSWDFDDSLLPVPIDDESCGKNGWAHRYIQKLEKSIFKGAVDQKCLLEKIGQLLTYGSEDEFRTLLYMGADQEGGLTSKILAQIYNGKLPDKRCHKYMGMQRDSKFQQHLNENLNTYDQSFLSQFFYPVKLDEESTQLLKSAFPERHI